MSKSFQLLVIATFVLTCNGCGPKTEDVPEVETPSVSSQGEGNSSPEEPQVDLQAANLTDHTEEDAVEQSDPLMDEQSQGDQDSTMDDVSDFVISLLETDPRIVAIVCPPGTDFDSVECEIYCVPAQLIPEDGGSLNFTMGGIEAEYQVLNHLGNTASGRTFTTLISGNTSFKYVTFSDMTGWVTDEGNLELQLHDDIYGEVKLSISLSLDGETVASESIDVDYSAE